MFVVIVTAGGQRLQIGRVYQSHGAARDLAEMVRKHHPTAAVSVERAPARKPRQEPRSIADLLG